MSAANQDTPAQGATPAPPVPPLLPRMSPAEVAAFTRYCADARAYVEFGCGGSTVVAAQSVRRQVIALDSDQRWLDKVSAACAASGARTMPQLVCVDIGPTREWGYPLDASRKADWPRYHEQVWGVDGADRADLYMIDGRFRVACLLQALLRARGHATILFHDYASRPHYHVIEPFVQTLAHTEELAAFRRHRRFSREKAEALLQHVRFDSR